MRVVAEEHPVSGGQRERVAGAFLPGQVLRPRQELLRLHAGKLSEGAVRRFPDPGFSGKGDDICGPAPGKADRAGVFLRGRVYRRSPAILRRSGQTIIPKGNTVLGEGDRLTIIGDLKGMNELKIRYGKKI